MDFRLISLAVPGKREKEITANTIKAVTISIWRRREARRTAVNIAALSETVPVGHINKVTKHDLYKHEAYSSSTT